jgi:hypothetical protein
VANRKNVSSLSSAQRTQLRNFLNQYIASANNPVAEHAAASVDKSLMIHGAGFIAWHQHFVAELETWLVNHGGAKFVPIPYWDPAKPIPVQLNNGNTNVPMPLPKTLSPGALKSIGSYTALNKLLVPYHGQVHGAVGGQMPSAATAPGDPIFWPFHSFLLAIYERWRNG